MSDVQEVDKRTFSDYLSNIDMIDEEELLHMEQIRAGKICKQHSECYRKKEQRLKTLDHCKIEEDTDNYIHDQRLYHKYGIADKLRNTR